MDNIVLYSLGIVWYIFCTIGFFSIITKNIELKIKGQMIIFILSLFWPLLLGVFGFAILMTKIEYKIKKTL